MYVCYSEIEPAIIIFNNCDIQFEHYDYIFIIQRLSWYLYLEKKNYNKKKDYESDIADSILVILKKMKNPMDKITTDTYLNILRNILDTHSKYKKDVIKLLDNINNYQIYDESPRESLLLFVSWRYSKFLMKQLIKQRCLLSCKDQYGRTFLERMSERHSKDIPSMKRAIHKRYKLITQCVYCIKDNISMFPKSKLDMLNKDIKKIVWDYIFFD